MSMCPCSTRAGLIPALAGTTRAMWRSVLPIRAHPRAGGDDRPSPPSSIACTGSSPRWRGRHHDAVTMGNRIGLIPALAGTTPSREPPSPTRWAHPRAGGDDDSYGEAVVKGAGSSPRWRGRLDRFVDRRAAPGLIPALAGTTGTAPAGFCRTRAHPRAGGDDGSCRATAIFEMGSSPRWRGRQGVGTVPVPGLGLIPALAGTTGARAGEARRSRAHPRAGGDDKTWYRVMMASRGSSPRWRGRQ